MTYENNIGQNPYFYNAIHTNNNNERDYAFHVREDLEVTAKIKKIETDGVLLELHATFQSGITTIIDSKSSRKGKEKAKNEESSSITYNLRNRNLNREELFDDSTMWHIGSLKFKIMDDEMSELHDKINALKKRVKAERLLAGLVLQSELKIDEYL
ncbi:8878_t:CDS:2, partial [Entrophospora sp. SA101]